MRKHTRIKTKTLVRINISCICTESKGHGMWIEGCVSFSVVLTLREAQLTHLTRTPACWARCIRNALLKHYFSCCSNDVCMDHFLPT